MEIWFNQMEFHPIPWVHLREVTFRDQSSTSGRVMVDGCGWCMMVPYAIAVSPEKMLLSLGKNVGATAISTF